MRVHDMKLVNKPDREVIRVQRRSLRQVGTGGLVEDVFNIYRAHALSCFSYQLPMVPKSLNNQYIHRGKGRKYDLDPQIKLLRDETRAVLSAKPYWRPSGITAALIVFYSPRWVSRENAVRRIDVDNKVKAILDAFELVTGVGDERNWMVTACKRLAKKDMTLVVLYDLGDLVDEWEGE
jgi:hypothetical protein